MTTKTNPLDQAADYLQEHGWCRNDWYTANGKACLAGAIGVVTGALRPVTPEKRVKLIEKDAQLYTNTPEARERYVKHALKRGERTFVWSKSKAALNRYHKAAEVLATELADSATLQDRLTAFDDDVADRRLRDSYVNATDSGKRDYEDAWAAARVDIFVNNIVGFNDTEDHVYDDATERTTVRRTTKAQAIKLLRKAAARW